MLTALIIIHYEHTYLVFQMCYGLGQGLTLTLLITTIIQHCRGIITHYKNVHNAL